MPASPVGPTDPVQPDPVQPVVFAPRRLRVVGVVVAVALVALTFYGWFALPREVRVLFTVSQLLTLLGFLAAVALRSTGVLPQGVLDVAAQLTTLLLSAAMFGLGTGIVARHLWPVPVRALVLATASTLVAGGVALALVTLLV